MRVAWLGCALGTIALLLHLGVAWFKYRHVPGLTKLLTSFFSAGLLVSISWGMWPVLSDPSVKNIDITDDLLKAMWIGYIAAIAIAAVYVVETGKGMAERGNTLKEPPEKPGPDQDGG